MNTKLNTFLWLLWRDIRALRKTFFNQWIDYSFILFTMVVVFGYFMAPMGIDQNFGVLMLISQITAGLAWMSMSDAGAWAYDLAGPKAISYELTLPISYPLVYLKYACAFAIKSIVINLAALPVGMLLVFNKIDFSAISPIKFLGAYILAGVVFALYNLFIAVLYKNVDSYNRFWMRWGMIIWMFSGLYAPWYAMSQASVWAGYALLCNPFVYNFESLHAAFMGQGQFINFWACLAAMVGFGILFAVGGLYLFKKRLDCV